MFQLREYAPVTEVIVLIGTLLVIYLLLKRLSFQAGDNTKKYAPSVGCFPLIGSLPYLPNPRDIHRWSLEKSYKLGGVFTFTVGNVYTVLLTSHEATREAFVQRSTDFADRNEHYMNRILTPGNKGIIFHPYDEEFKKYHQLSLSILKQFGFGQNIMETRIALEVEGLIKEIHALKGQQFYPQKPMQTAVQNIISRIAFGHPISSTDKVEERFIEIIVKWGHQLMTLLILDYMPFLKHLPYLNSKIHDSTKLTTELLGLLDQMIDKSLKDDTDESFVSCFVKKEGLNFDRAQLRLTLRDLVFAGSETVSTTILWAMILLANHPQVQDRLQKEIDSVVARERLPCMNDLPKLKYVEATILELMRCKTVAPFGVARRALCDTQVRGYFIPEGSQVFSMLYALHMDVRIWGDPAEFRPERFLDTDGNIINKNLVIPFSIGKRSCLGELMARQEVFLFLTGLVQQFNIQPPEGTDKIDETEQMEGALIPAPFEVRLLPRDDKYL